MHRIPLRLAYSLLVGLALLGGCADKGKCLQSHYEASGYYQWMYDYKGAPLYMYWVDTSGNVCNRWEFPNGRPN